MTEKEVLQVLLDEFYERISTMKDLVPRDAKFPVAPNKIKVAIGMRRVGKTFFIYQQILSLLQRGVPLSQILFINFEDDRILPLDQKKLALLIEAFYSIYPENHEQKCYLFLDEIQAVHGWDMVIRRFHDSKNTDIYLTGSSAKLLSKEIATSLRGRSLATEIWPYSFYEFMTAKNINLTDGLFSKKKQDKLSQYFEIYLTQGGFPEVTDYSADVRKHTLQDYVDIVLYRDIIERHEIKNISVVKYMMWTMIHNISNSFSINKFYNDLKSQGYKVTKDSLYEYAEYIEDAYFAFGVTIADRSIRKVQTNPKKYYVIDPGIVRAMTLDFESDLGKLFENIIYLDLRRLGCSVNYFLTTKRNEVDFLVKAPSGQKKLIQVVWDMADQTTFDRERRALEEAKEELSIDGEIITLTRYLREGVLV